VNGNHLAGLKIDDWPTAYTGRRECIIGQPGTGCCRFGLQDLAEHPMVPSRILTDQRREDFGIDAMILLREAKNRNVAPREVGLLGRNSQWFDVVELPRELQQDYFGQFRYGGRSDGIYTDGL